MGKKKNSGNPLEIHGDIGIEIDDKPILHTQLSEEALFINHKCALNKDAKTKVMRLSKIICSIGPSSREVHTLVKMMEAGMTIARLNLSYGSQEYHAETIENIRKAADKYSRNIGVDYPVSIGLDTRGPEIRTGLIEVESAHIELQKGDTLKLTTDKAYADKVTKDYIYVDYANITRVTKSGVRVLIDDSAIALLVNNVGSNFLSCTVEIGGMLGSKKKVNLAGVVTDLPAVSEKDKLDLQFGVIHEVDMIFASFVRTPSALTEIRDILGEGGKHILVIAKIETNQAMLNVNDIIAAADGIVIPRGDLSIEMPLEKSILAQKTIIARCNKVGKPVIVSTQVLESMTNKPRTIRLEISDVANTIIDGADAMMLSEETSKGDYPVECVRTLAVIIREAEVILWQKSHFQELVTLTEHPVTLANTMSISVVQASINCLAAIIIVVTTSGRSAQIIGHYRPRCPIVAVTRYPEAARVSCLHRGLYPVVYKAQLQPDWYKDVDSRIQLAINYSLARGFLNGGDPLIIVSGWKQGSVFTNTMRVAYAPLLLPEHTPH